ncbi:MAG: uracil-DNA glycosylase [Filifactoraceae bacterium]
MIIFNNQWDELLEEEFQKEYYVSLREFLKKEYKTQIIYPNMYDIFNALKYTDYKEVKVVILGQDPYHGYGQAHGLSFSVQKGVKPPPSLINIYKELKGELGIEIPNHGELTTWAKQGVLLLNTCLTVREGQPNSHRGKGWEVFTNKIIEHLNNLEEPIVFLLWGANAKAKVEIINNPKHLILTSVHPSPLSAHGGFFGCNHFKLANEYLEKYGRTPIDWRIY